MGMKYMIGSGYHNRPGCTWNEFYPVWYANTMRYATPSRVVILASGGTAIPYAAGHWIPMNGDLGHTHDLSNDRKPYHWCGWSISIVTLALLAYFDECDFIFKEQDTLAFGPWVEKMYAEIGDHGCIFGKGELMPAFQSLFLVKHEFIPEFVRIYMGTGSERLKENEGELKFARMKEQNPQHFTHYSFGVDRDRPIPYDAEVFYAQHLNQEELAEMKSRRLI
jgi:hypothetical protein